MVSGVEAVAVLLSKNVCLQVVDNFVSVKNGRLGAGLGNTPFEGRVADGRYDLGCNTVVGDEEPKVLLESLARLRVACRSPQKDAGHND